MNCDCVQKVNETLKSKHLALKLHAVLHTDPDAEEWATTYEMAIETVSLKKGIKPVKLFFPFCPFCGKPSETSSANLKKESEKPTKK